MASSDGSIICAMRWVSTNDQEPFPASPLELICFRYRAISTKLLPQVRYRKQKVGPQPTPFRSATAEYKVLANIMDTADPARPSDYPGIRGRRLMRRKTAVRPATRAFSSYRVAGQSCGRVRQSKGRRATHSKAG
jgi:hypothetical protein